MIPIPVYWASPSCLLSLLLASSTFLFPLCLLECAPWCRACAYFEARRRKGLYSATAGGYKQQVLVEATSRSFTIIVERVINERIAAFPAVQNGDFLVILHSLW